jgi:hypothetical protein
VAGCYLTGLEKLILRSAYRAWTTSTFSPRPRRWSRHTCRRRWYSSAAAMSAWNRLSCSRISASMSPSSTVSLPRANRNSPTSSARSSATTASPSSRSTPPASSRPQPLTRTHRVRCGGDRRARPRRHRPRPTHRCIGSTCRQGRRRPARVPHRRPHPVQLEPPCLRSGRRDGSSAVHLRGRGGRARRGAQRPQRPARDPAWVHYRGLPSVIFTQPQLASAGLTEVEALAGPPVRVPHACAPRRPSGAGEPRHARRGQGRRRRRRRAGPASTLSQTARARSCSPPPTPSAAG